MRGVAAPARSLGLTANRRPRCALPHVSSNEAFMMSPMVLVVSKSVTKEPAHSSRLQQNRGIMRF